MESQIPREQDQKLMDCVELINEWTKSVIDKSPDMRYLFGKVQPISSEDQNKLQSIMHLDSFDINENTDELIQLHLIDLAGFMGHNIIYLTLNKMELFYAHAIDSSVVMCLGMNRISENRCELVIYGTSNQTVNHTVQGFGFTVMKDSMRVGVLSSIKFINHYDLKRGKLKVHSISKNCVQAERELMEHETIIDRRRETKSHYEAYSDLKKPLEHVSMAKTFKKTHDPNRMSKVKFLELSLKENVVNRNYYKKVQGMNCHQMYIVDKLYLLNHKFAEPIYFIGFEEVWCDNIIVYYNLLYVQVDKTDNEVKRYIILKGDMTTTSPLFKKKMIIEVNEDIDVQADRFNDFDYYKANKLKLTWVKQFNEIWERKKKEIPFEINYVTSNERTYVVDEGGKEIILEEIKPELMSGTGISDIWLSDAVTINMKFRDGISPKVWNNKEGQYDIDDYDRKGDIYPLITHTIDCASEKNNAITRVGSNLYQLPCGSFVSKFYAGAHNHACVAKLLSINLLDDEESNIDQTNRCQTCGLGYGHRFMKYICCKGDVNCERMNNI